MELSALAAKQQRVKSWVHFMDTQVQSGEIRQRMGVALERYRGVIARCWKAEKISAADEHELDDCERQLELLDEQARVTVVGRQPSENIPRLF